MARMPAGQPRSVPDPDGEAIDEMLRKERLKRARAEQVVGHPSVSGQTRRRADEILERVDRNPVARSAAVGAVRVAGNAAGVVRGVGHAAEGLADGAVFAGRLLLPDLDRAISPAGETAGEQLGRATKNAARTVGNYITKGVKDPKSVLNDIRVTGRQWNRALNPEATPVAPTFSGELRRNFAIGQNQGELAFDVGSLVVGGPAAKAIRGVSGVSSIGNVERYVAQGFGPRAAARLAEPYPASGMGSHFVARDTKLPAILGGGSLPRRYLDGPFNKLVPPGSSIGDMYERHFAVDPRFYGTKAGGERWSGRDLGLPRYGPLGQLWYGSPAPLKARVGGLGAAAGNGLYDLNGEGNGW